MCEYPRNCLQCFWGAVGPLRGEHQLDQVSLPGGARARGYSLAPSCYVPTSSSLVTEQACWQAPAVDGTFHLPTPEVSPNKPHSPIFVLIKYSIKAM